MKTNLKNKFFLSLIFAFLGFSIQAQFSCSSAVAINNGYTSGWITTPGTGGAQDWVTSAASCAVAASSSFTDKDVYMYKYTTGNIAGESFYITLEQDYVTDGPHSIGVWTSCSTSSLSGCVTSAYIINKNIIGLCAQNLAANTTYYIGIGKQYWVNTYLKFKIVEFKVESSLTAPNDECSAASPLNVFLPYTGSTRCNFTASAGSPSSCGTIENDSWMKFTAGSSSITIDYRVYNCTYDYGVQLAVFRGACGSNTLISGSCINYASNNSSGTWTFSGLTIGATYYIRADGYAGDLCSYAFTPVSGVLLPVELIDFYADDSHESSTKLHWTTASETNNAYFQVEKSDDAVNFYSIGKVKSAGNSDTKLDYVLEDLSVNHSSTSYYRLKQVDNDGGYEYSKTISVNRTKTNKITVFPNPSSNGIFEFAGLEFEKIQEIKVYDLFGKEILAVSGQDLKSNSINLSMYESGIYQIMIINADEVTTSKIVIE